MQNGLKGNWGFREENVPISELQLETWSHQGGVDGAQNTHNAIRTALEQYTWQDSVKYDNYLQGSYRNFTNIYGNSDVDLTVELTTVFYHNFLTEAQKSALMFASATYRLDNFREDVISALRNYFGSQYVETSGGKSIKILPNGNRLKGDVVVAATYRHYDGTKLIAEGITFWDTKTGEQIINYPKLHFENGATKHANTLKWYKPTVRIYKNARERIYKNKPLLAGKFPSYFIECLMYNVPDEKYGQSYQSTFCNAVNWLDEALKTDPSQFVCQNRMFYLFGSNSTQWNVSDAKTFVYELTLLWNS